MASVLANFSPATRGRLGNWLYLDSRGQTIEALTLLLHPGGDTRPVFVKLLEAVGLRARQCPRTRTDAVVVRALRTTDDCERLAWVFRHLRLLAVDSRPLAPVLTALVAHLIGALSRGWGAHVWDGLLHLKDEELLDLTNTVIVVDPPGARSAAVARDLALFMSEEPRWRTTTIPLTDTNWARDLYPLQV